MRTDRIDFLDVGFSRITLPQLKRQLARVSSTTPYSYLVTPNVDHIVSIHSEPALKRLYSDADFCVCDSRILRALARLRNIFLPLIPGSDLTAIFFNEVIVEGDRIAIVGGDQELLVELGRRYPGVEFRHHVPPMGLRADPNARQAAAAFVAEERARFTLLIVGSPQQEMIAREVRTHTSASGLALCVGASLEFLTGTQRRAPQMMRKLGLEWAFRLASNPRRLWRRYLVDGMRIFPIYIRWRGAGHSRMLVAGLFTFLIVPAIIFAAVIHSRTSNVERSDRSVETVLKRSKTLVLPPPNALKPVTPEEAAKENAERPFVGRADEPAARLLLQSDQQQRLRATDCLAQAVFYEAASEGLDGGRAVAQVVLNRLRHPAYPASVCGVIYQGSERTTGCQFSFTCDGSLARVPPASLWKRSVQIAEEALSGRVFAPVGHSTHYHANYVLPYWADSLDKSAQIGNHIFYRLQGSLGSKSAFRQRYRGVEPDVSIVPAKLAIPDVASVIDLKQNVLAGVGSNSGLIPSEPLSQAAPSDLLIDKTVSVLINDPATRAEPSKRNKPVDCADRGDSQLRPLAAERLKSEPSSDGCEG